jgi:hypothetical protein
MDLARLAATASTWTPGSSPGVTEEGRSGVGDGLAGPRKADRNALDHFTVAVRLPDPYSPSSPSALARVAFGEA